MGRGSQDRRVFRTGKSAGGTGAGGPRTGKWVGGPRTRGSQGQRVPEQENGKGVLGQGVPGQRVPGQGVPGQENEQGVPGQGGFQSRGGLRTEECPEQGVPGQGKGQGGVSRTGGPRTWGPRTGGSPGQGRSPGQRESPGKGVPEQEKGERVPGQGGLQGKGCQDRGGFHLGKWGWG